MSKNCKLKTSDVHCCFPCNQSATNQQICSCHVTCFQKKWRTQVEFPKSQLIPKNVGNLVENGNGREMNVCAGQNKNWTVIRFLHHVVVHGERFHHIKVSFPVRGHSYMECDRDMAVVNQKVRAETPEDWMRELSTCRKKPSPFNVVKMEPHMFQNVTEHIKCNYRAVSPVPTRPIREIIFNKEHPRMFQYRESWHGPFQTAVVSKAVGRRSIARQQPIASLYSKRLPVSDAKYADLQVLKAFCKPESQQFFSELPHAGAKLVSESESDLE